MDILLKVSPGATPRILSDLWERKKTLMDIGLGMQHLRRVPDWIIHYSTSVIGMSTQKCYTDKDTLLPICISLVEDYS
jgi:hypothetical protein